MPTSGASTLGLWDLGPFNGYQANSWLQSQGSPAPPRWSSRVELTLAQVLTTNNDALDSMLVLYIHLRIKALLGDLGPYGSEEFVILLSYQELAFLGP